MEHEQKRREQLEKLFNRTKEQVDEESYLIEELKKIEIRKKERERKQQDVNKLLTAVVDFENTNNQAKLNALNNPANKQRSSIENRTLLGSSGLSSSQTNLATASHNINKRMKQRKTSTQSSSDLMKQASAAVNPKLNAGNLATTSNNNSANNSLNNSTDTNNFTISPTTTQDPKDSKGNKKSLIFKVEIKFFC